jgi:hypothetical protein
MDDINNLKKLAGITTTKTNINFGEPNISYTGMEKAELMKKHNIKPGTEEWFRLWFTRPYLTNTDPLDPKFRK